MSFESKIFSKTTQSDSNIVIDFPNAKTKFRLGIRARLTSLGAVGNEYIAELATGKFKGVQLLQPSRSVTTATQKLLGFQKKIANAMLVDFERRLPTPPVVTRLKEAFSITGICLGSSSGHTVMTNLRSGGMTAWSGL